MPYFVMIENIDAAKIAINARDLKVGSCVDRSGLVMILIQGRSKGTLTADAASLLTAR